MEKALRPFPVFFSFYLLFVSADITWLGCPVRVGQVCELLPRTHRIETVVAPHPKVVPQTRRVLLETEPTSLVFPTKEAPSATHVGPPAGPLTAELSTIGLLLWQFSTEVTVRRVDEVLHHLTPDLLELCHCGYLTYSFFRRYSQEKKNKNQFFSCVY